MYLHIRILTVGNRRARDICEPCTFYLVLMQTLNCPKKKNQVYSMGREEMSLEVSLKIFVNIHKHCNKDKLVCQKDI